MNSDILGVLAKVRMATIIFVMYVLPSVRLHETTRLPLYGFLWNFKIWYFSIQILLRSDETNRYFTWRPMYIYDNISPSSS